MRRIVAGRIIGSWVAGLAVVGLALLPGNPRGVAQDRPGEPNPVLIPEFQKGVPDPRAPAPPPAPEPQGVSFHGRVVDDDTGRAIEEFGLQERWADIHDPAKSAWSGYVRTIPGSYTIPRGGKPVMTPNPEGKFDSYLDFRESNGRRVDGLRILADGYEPRALNASPIGLADAGKSFEVGTIRLKRGRPLVGRITDHLGRPASGARLYLLRPGSRDVRIRDDVIGEGSDRGLLDPSVTRAAADADGRFRITGVGDADTIGISAPTLHHWHVPVPAPGREADIRLPEPATIRVPVKMDGDLPEAKFNLYAHLEGISRDRLTIWRTFTVGNPGELVLRDIAPGRYQFSREKRVTVGAEGWDVGMETQDISVESGREHLADFVRKPGRPLVGKVISPAGDPARMIFVGIESLAPKPGDKPDPFQPDLTDAVACDAAGRFRTAPLPPGEYRIHAKAYRQRPRYGPFVAMIEPIDFHGSATTRLPAEGNAPAVEIRLKDVQAMQADPGGVAARSGRPGDGPAAR